MMDLIMWVVYDSPRDYPGKYVARRWMTGPYPDGLPTDEVIVSDDLEDIRDELSSRGLVCLERYPGDEPQIVECWV